MKVKARTLVVALLAGLVLVAATWQAWPVREGMAGQQTPATAPTSNANAAEPSVINGVLADYQRYPWFCSVYTEPNLTLICGGVLVAPRLVLSAAHCLNPTWVLVGGKTRVQVEQIVRQGKAHIPYADWMLLQLKTAVTEMPIKIATRMPPNRTSVTVAGRGWKSWKNEKHDTTFTRTYMTYLDYPTALAEMKASGLSNKQTYVDFLKNPGTGMLVSPPRRKTTTCKGDSGGPIFVEKGLGQDELIGLTTDDACNGEEGKAITIFCKVAGRFRSVPNGIIVPPV